MVKANSYLNLPKQELSVSDWGMEGGRVGCIGLAYTVRGTWFRIPIKGGQLISLQHRLRLSVIPFLEGSHAPQRK